VKSRVAVVARSLVSSLVVATSLAAQAPRITPKGDPSVKSDTIYRLAVQPADHPEDAYAVLLDDGVVRYEADGRGTRTFRMVVQILKEEAIESFAEHRLGFSPGRQKLTVNWMRVLRPDGTVISDRPAVSQEANVPAAMGDPVYTDQRVRRVTLSGVAIGTIVDYSYTVEVTNPALQGDWTESWSVHMGVPVRRSRYVLELPESVTPRIKERNLDFQRVERVANGRRTYTWARADVPKLKGEPFAADSNGVHMNIAISSPVDWQRVASWYAGLARNRYAVTPALASKVDSLVRTARTRDDSIRAVHRWVAQDIRYVSVSLGMGGYQPRTPEQTITTGFGDCKDKATIFVAALGHLGVQAYPVLLAAGGGVDRTMPSIEAFDHAIAAVQQPNGYAYVDLTSPYTPFGTLPYSEQGEFGLLVHPDGRGEEITFPADSVAANASITRIVGTLAPDGYFDGTYEESATGARAPGLRSAFATPLDSTRRADFQRSLAQGLFDGATGDSLRLFDGKDLAATPRVSVRVKRGRAATPTGDLMILKLPVNSMQAFGKMAAELEARPPRRFPIDAEDVMGGDVAVTELRITLPSGWRARLPKSVKAPSPFGSYETTYEQVGDELRLTRRMTGARGVLPPERFPDLIAWMRSVAQDDQDIIVLERAPTAPTGASKS
jgi:transglutaminase-like putative cysteine protease